MSGPELPLAILSTVDLCIKYGGILAGTCNAFKNANNELYERIVRVEAAWNRISFQLDNIERIARLMDDRHREIHDQTLEILVSKLKTTIMKLKSVSKPRQGTDLDPLQINEGEMLAPRSWKFALLKETIDKAIEELETWQKVSDPSWLLILRAKNTSLNEQLPLSNGRGDGNPITQRTAECIHQPLGAPDRAGTTIFLPEDELHRAKIVDIPYAEAKLARRAGSSRWMVIDQYDCPSGVVVDNMVKNMRDLAKKLRHGDSEMLGFLVCKGVVRENDAAAREAAPPRSPTRLTMVFAMPNRMYAPQSLRKQLLDGDNIPFRSLTEKFQIATRMAQVLSYVHTFGFVHKNIRPEAILMLLDERSATRSPFLVGFENIRKEDGRTYRRGDFDWQRNLYRHPTRQGGSPSMEYIMQHDIYSLGVCLLEVGLWQSLVQLAPEGNVPVPSVLLQDRQDGVTTSLQPWELKDRLVVLAEGQLPRYMGNKYSEVVITCLTCLDVDNADFGDEREFQDEDGIHVGVRYIEKVSSTPKL
ncbi:hypothetical protein FOMA001_g17882 [Fusarium oxysporum f. sp. matthiolae]|nr:hypothetical protein FOMA001_g17882 [Fusarium oxysporum f. sp. matthiolae]